MTSREIGSTASSLHALLSDHGYGWGRDETGAIYAGPTRHPLSPGDRIVVDEGGMVDLPTANVLAELAIEQGVGLVSWATRIRRCRSGTRAR